jgi:SAM-dependent methyltransferase
LIALGWDAEGLDIDPTAAERASALSGAKVHVATLGEFRSADAYDLIYSSHSLEHLPDTRTTISHIKSLLNPGGRLVAVLPNGASLVTRVYGCESVTLDPPRHLVLPSLDGLAGALLESGFTVKRMRTLARRSSNYAAIARARRLGARGPAAWTARADSFDRAVAIIERVLAAARVGLGEEIYFEAEVSPR